MMVDPEKPSGWGCAITALWFLGAVMIVVYILRIHAVEQKAAVPTGQHR